MGRRPKRLKPVSAKPGYDIRNLLLSSPRKKSVGSPSPASSPSKPSLEKHVDMAKTKDKGSLMVKISDSDSDSDGDSDDDLLVLLGGKNADKAAVGANPFSAIEGCAMLRSPPKRNLIPELMDDSSLKLWKKSARLFELHEQDDAKSLSIIKKKEEFRKLLESKLDKEVLKDESYIEYLSQNKENPRLKDFFYFDKAWRYEENPSSPHVALFAVNLGQSLLTDVEVVNQPSVFLVKRSSEAIQDRQRTFAISDIDSLLEALGVSEDRLSMKTLTHDDLDFNSKCKRQSVDLVIAKLEYITKLVCKQSEYREDIFMRMIEVLGFVMMDFRVLSSNVSLSLTRIVNDLLQWQYKSVRDVKFELITSKWIALTELIDYNYRIVSTLVPTVSTVVAKLRRWLALSLLVDELPPVTLATTEEEIDKVVYQSILGAIQHLVDSKDVLTDVDYDTLMTKLKAVSLCIITDKHPLLEPLARVVKQLETKVPVSFTGQAQASCRSTLLMLQSTIDAHQMKPKNSLYS